MLKITLASQNQGKINEFKQLLQALPIELISLDQLPGSTEVEETGLTFIENALLKARHAAKLSGLPALADDSGLVVQALNGAPGIYSARYAGAQASAESNIAKLLQDLRATPEQERQAFFYCILVFLAHPQDPSPLVCEGRWQGEIALTPQGSGGFGYDPIFYIPELGKCAAELTALEKNKLSHRAQALQNLVQSLPYKLKSL
jgi:XTP/dITP diphosphohydrolase